MIKLKKPNHQITAWQDNLDKLNRGEFGQLDIPRESLETLARYWKAQAEAGYPYAVENMWYFEEMLRRENE